MNTLLLPNIERTLWDALLAIEIGYDSGKNKIIDTF